MKVSDAMSRDVIVGSTTQSIRDAAKMIKGAPGIAKLSNATPRSPKQCSGTACGDSHTTGPKECPNCSVARRDNTLAAADRM